MALARPLPPLWQTLLPALHGPVRPVLNVPLLQRLTQPFRALPVPFAALAAPALSLPSIPSLADIWEGILKAVPKKKMSYRKKRQRFLAGKGLKDITSLGRCSACGRIKRAHLLCPYCVDAIKTHFFKDVWWSVRMPTRKQHKQLLREERGIKKFANNSKPDPREEKPVLPHTDWSKR